MTPPTPTDDVLRLARELVSLFVWEPNDDGHVVPHLDRAFPDFNASMTALREALRARDEALAKGEGRAALDTERSE